MAFQLRARGYRGLPPIEWSPRGVCAVVGANGAGKTRLLELPEFLSQAMQHGLAQAIAEYGDVGPDASFELAGDGARWRMVPAQTARGYRPEETVWVGERVVARREAGSDEATMHGEVIAVEHDLAFGASIAETTAEERELARALMSYRMYGPYDLLALRRNGAPAAPQQRLHRYGANAFGVLRFWRDRPNDRARYDFVVDGLRAMFAIDVALDSARLGGIDAGRAPNGWLVGMLQLIAVAGTSPHDAIAIDEPENGLHPRAIARLLEAMRAWASRHEVTILLATHSPVVLSGFDACPDQLFAMLPGRDVLPVAALDLHARDRLAHVALGDLHVRGELDAG